MNGVYLGWRCSSGSASRARRRTRRSCAAPRTPPRQPMGGRGGRALRDCGIVVQDEKNLTVSLFEMTFNDQNCPFRGAKRRHTIDNSPFQDLKHRFAQLPRPACGRAASRRAAPWWGGTSCAASGTPRTRRPSSAPAHTARRAS